MIRRVLCWLKSNYRFVVETFVIGFMGISISAQSNQLSKVANTIAEQANSLSKEANNVARKEYGIEITDIETTPPKLHAPATIMGFEGLTIVDKTLNYNINIRELNGVQQLKLLSKNGNVIQSGSSKRPYLLFKREELQNGEVNLYFSDEIREEDGSKIIHSAPLATSIEAKEQIGHYRYFYILAEYNESFQLYLVAMKNSHKGEELFEKYKVYNKFDIHELKYSDDKVFKELDRKMADEYETIYNQYNELKH